MRLVSLALLLLTGTDGGTVSYRINLKDEVSRFDHADLDDYFETDIACANGAIPKASLKGHTLHIVCARDGGR